jgi:hypothetical protein
MAEAFQPGDIVVWWKGVGGGFVAPVLATVVRVTARRVTITADDPDEKGQGIVTRHVSPGSLQLHQRTQAAPPSGAVTRKPRRRE